MLKIVPGEIWSFLETENGKLQSTAPKMASEATRDCGLFEAMPCGVLVGPSSNLSLMEEIEGYGLEKVYFIEAEEPLSPEALAEKFVFLTNNQVPQLMLFAATPFGSDLAARIAARLKKGIVSNCADFELIEGKFTAKKPVHEGKSYGYYNWCGNLPYIATVNVDSLEAVEADKKIAPEIVHEKYEALPTRTHLAKRWKIPHSELDITESRLVIGVGNGINKTEFMQVIKELAESLEAGVGGTRLAVFRGLVPVEGQIGATGKFIDADIYIPIGISGSNRHTVGISTVKHVIPINIYRDAPIFKFAELGIVGDLYEVVPSLLDSIRKQMNAGKDAG